MTWKRFIATYISSISVDKSKSRKGQAFVLKYEPEKREIHKWETGVNASSMSSYAIHSS